MVKGLLQLELLFPRPAAAAWRRGSPVVAWRAVKMQKLLSNSITERRSADVLVSWS
jgi:hypothetical protein